MRAAGGIESGKGGVRAGIRRRLCFDTNGLEHSTPIRTAYNRELPFSRPRSNLTISRDGALLATASRKGTVVRIFLLPSLRRICTLRRGSTHAIITSVSFSPPPQQPQQQQQPAAGELVAVASDHGSVHLFRRAP